MADSYDLTRLDAHSFQHMANLLALQVLGAGHTSFGPGPAAVEMAFSKAKLRIQVKLTAGAAHGTYNQNSTSHTCLLTHRSGSYSRYHWSFRSLLDLIRAECGQQTGSSSLTSIRQELLRQVASTRLDNWSTRHDPDLLNAFTSGEDVRYWTSLRSIPKWRSTTSNSYHQGMSSPLSTTKSETRRLGSTKYFGAWWSRDFPSSSSPSWNRQARQPIIVRAYTSYLSIFHIRQLRQSLLVWPCKVWQQRALSDTALIKSSLTAINGSNGHANRRELESGSSKGSRAGKVHGWTISMPDPTGRDNSRQ